MLWLTVRYAVGRPVSIASWWIGAGFAVSCATDLLVLRHIVPQWIASPVYLVSQGALISAAMLPPMEAWATLMTLVCVGEAALLFNKGATPDVFLHTTTFLTTWLVALRARSGYRWSLGAYFGAGLLAWWGYCLDPGWPSWLSYQACRLLAVGLFVVASIE